MDNYSSWLTEIDETYEARKGTSKLNINKPFRFTLSANSTRTIEFDEYPNWFYFQSLSGVDIDVCFGTSFSLPNSFVITDARLIAYPAPKERSITFRNNNSVSADFCFIMADR